MHSWILPIGRAGATLLVVLALPAAASAQKLATEIFASGFASPVWVGAPVGDLERLFVVEQDSGLIRIIKNRQVLDTPFLNVGAALSQGGEQGLLGMAFHPAFAVNGRFFIHYTDVNGDTRVVEFMDSGDPDVADAMPVQTILAQTQPYDNHNGGNLAFGADGMLYIGLGDGGSGGDPENRAQDGTTNLGKMLRLDVDRPAPFIPADNPFLGDPSINDEIWALGLRNPWRYSFDRLTGDLYIGDVGQADREEVDFQSRSSTGGENYGWRCMEGSSCSGDSGCSCTDLTLDLPIYEYDHSSGDCSVIGGYVYRGLAMPWFQGSYLFGDFCTSNLWSFRYIGGLLTEFVDRTPELEPPGTPTVQRITSFGEDGVGELYIVDAMGGEIFKVVPMLPCQISTYCMADPNSTGSPAAIGSSGSASLAQNDLVLLVTSCPVGQFGVFFYGPDQTDVPFGSGHMCVGGGATGVFRLNPPQHIPGSGQCSRTVDYLRPPMDSGDGQITVASTWNFQFWFRDPAGGGAGFDTSDGLSILFCL